MTTATEFLDTFNNSFVNKDNSYLDAIMAENCTIHFTGLHQTMTRRECLNWSEFGFCKGCYNYEIIQDTDDSIAGTHRAWGSSEEDGEWNSNCFFFAKKMGGKIIEWYVHARPIVDQAITLIQFHPEIEHHTLLEVANLIAVVRPLNSDDEISDISNGLTAAPAPVRLRIICRYWHILWKIQQQLRQLNQIFAVR